MLTKFVMTSRPAPDCSTCLLPRQEILCRQCLYRVYERGQSKSVGQQKNRFRSKNICYTRKGTNVVFT